jgi:RNA exonuclease 1
LSLQPDIAHLHSLAQELEISTTSSSVRTYKPAIHHAAVSISRRPRPDNLFHPSVGTIRDSRLATEKAEKAKLSRLTPTAIAKYCLPLSDFKLWGYPDISNRELVEGGGESKDGQGEERVCSRCKVPFTVSGEDLEGRFGECRYHPLRTAPQRVEGKRKWIFGCCGKERGEGGCEDGVHVFSEGDDDLALKKRVGFRSVAQISAELKEKGVAVGWVDVVGLDCEMISKFDFSYDYTRVDAKMYQTPLLESVSLGQL